LRLIAYFVLFIISAAAFVIADNSAYNWVRPTESSASVTDVWVNETGDNMTGSLRIQTTFEATANSTHWCVGGSCPTM
jgi:hypothetical protein